MKKQIYFKKQPVKMGERVTVNGVTLEVNDQSIENNPDWFEVEETKSEKTLEDYVHEAIDEDPALMAKLKQRYPKLFYTHVLQKIADDINPNDKDNWGNTWFIEHYSLRDEDERRYEPYGYITVFPGSVQFSSKEAAEEAIEIMGDKLDYIFKS